MTKERANKIYDILVSIGGAYENERDDFIWAHCEDKYECWEWRFRGHLGGGGKYRSQWNGVTYYREDETPERIQLKKRLDEALQELDN